MTDTNNCYLCDDLSHNLQSALLARVPAKLFCNFHKQQLLDEIKHIANTSGGM